MYQQPAGPGQQQSHYARSMPHLYTWPALTAFILLYLSAWVFVGVAGSGDPATQNNPLLSILISLGVVSLLTLHACLICIDGRNFLTCNGKIVWRSLRGWPRVGLVVAYGACWIMPSLYLCLAITYWWKVRRGGASCDIQHNTHQRIDQPQAVAWPPYVPPGAAVQNEDTRPLLPGVLPRTRVFISYSQKDEEHVQRLKTHFAHYERKGMIEIWDETKIAPGALWQEEIRKAIARTKVVLLLVSADYLASQWVTENELPPLLHAAYTEGATIIPVIVSACAFADSELARFQTVNSPEKPLSSLRWDERETIWATVAQMVSGAMGQRPPLARPNALPPLIERKKERKGLSERETARAQQLVLEQPVGWTSLLTAELLSARLIPVRQKLSEIDHHLVYQEHRPMRGDLFFHRAQQQSAICMSLVRFAATVLYNEVPAFWEAARTAGDPLAIKRAVEKIVGVCYEMLKQKREVHALLVPGQLAALQRIMQGWSVAFIDELGSIPAHLAAPFAQTPAPGSGLPLSLTLREPAGLSAFGHEVKRIQARVKRHGERSLFS